VKATATIRLSLHIWKRNVNNFAESIFLPQQHSVNMYDRRMDTIAVMASD